MLHAHTMPFYIRDFIIRGLLCQHGVEGGDFSGTNSPRIPRDEYMFACLCAYVCALSYACNCLCMCAWSILSIIYFWALCGRVGGCCWTHSLWLQGVERLTGKERSSLFPMSCLRSRVRACGIPIGHSFPSLIFPGLGHHCIWTTAVFSYSIRGGRRQEGSMVLWVQPVFGFSSHDFCSHHGPWFLGAISLPHLNQLLDLSF